MDRHDFTIPTLVRDLGFEPEPALTWAVGARIRERWIADTGSLPEKRLRAKTSGTGSHCLAVYPARFYQTAADITYKLIEAIEVEECSQMRLFEDAPQGSA